MSIKVGCAGFPIGQTQYQSRLKTVELVRCKEGLPRAETAEKWRSTAPAEFDFVMCLPKAALHVSSSGFKQPGKTVKNRSAKNASDAQNLVFQTQKMGEVLRSRLLLVPSTSSLSPHPDNIGKLHTFFKTTTRGKMHFVWEVPAGWPRNLVETFERNHQITSIQNPLSESYQARPAAMRYFRMGDLKRTKGIYSFSDEELKQIKNACDKPLCYVIFNNGPTAYRDAIRFSSLI